jgi:penicillin-binding protein 1C
MWKKINIHLFKRRKTKLFLILFIFFLLFLLFWFSLPNPLFNNPTSTILEAEKGELLSARIAIDGQWRFPHIKQVPEKFKKAILAYEDKNFYSHLGIDFLSLAQATKENIKAGKIKRGGSTLTMQVIRIAKKNPKRIFLEKVKELFQAVRLEISYSKEEILKLYSSEAPFGGNVVGLEAASWRYFGQSPDKLSWAEAATLAVLPNSPSLIFPGKNQERLKIKRDKLLFKLKQTGELDEMTYQLAIQEPVPGPPHALPYLAPHLLSYCEKRGLGGKRNLSTIDITLHKRVNKILEMHHEKLSGNGIHNAAAIVLEVETGNVLSYCGNIIKEGREKNYWNDVDIIQSPRSTGSILKPLLFSMILNDGRLLEKSLVPDIPTLIAGYAPKNFYLTYDGAVSFQQSISRSLNVPAVRLLQEYGYEKFHNHLKKLGMSTLTRPANHYGLSIILGGAEGTLYDMASIYRNMALSLNHYHENLNQEKALSHYKALILKEENQTDKSTFTIPVTPASIYLMMEAMNEVSRPDEEAGWKDYISAYKIAWKTGTSFGYRDGWAIGCTPQYVVAVWVGNADGEGRPELTGIATAAPIMFDIFKLLKSNRWFMQPFNDMTKTTICRKSGYRSTSLCDEVDTLWIQKQGGNSPLCPYHKIIHLDQSEKHQVTSECESTNNMVSKSWFVLPPAMEYYFKNKNSSYIMLPPFRQDCYSSIQQHKSFEVIYPQPNSKIYVPIELDGKPGRTVFQVAHRNPAGTLFWYLDNYYLGTTKDFHQIGVNPESGTHKLTVTDETGERKVVMFEVIENEKGMN